jgi:hypothetical protein
MSASLISHFLLDLREMSAPKSGTTGPSACLSSFPSFHPVSSQIHTAIHTDFGDTMLTLNQSSNEEMVLEHIGLQRNKELEGEEALRSKPYVVSDGTLDLFEIRPASSLHVRVDNEVNG